MALVINLKLVFNDYDRVLMIPEFEQECVSILENKGELKRYYRSMKKKCEYLQANINNHGGRYRSGYLEPMKGREATDLSKIPISGNKKNYRIILCFKEINGIGCAIFLHLFQKKREKSDYREAIKKAKNRYNEIVR